MGKSTTINSICGMVHKYEGNENPPEWDEIFKHYSGTELKQHFQKIEQNQIRASIKPQQIHHLAESFWNDRFKMCRAYNKRIS